MEEEEKGGQLLPQQQAQMQWAQAQAQAQEQWPPLATWTQMPGPSSGRMLRQQ